MRNCRLSSAPMKQGTDQTAKALVVAFANQKGGVGKTTSAVNMGAALAIEEDRRVLLVDLDPQGNATAGLGVEVVRGDPAIFNVIVGGESIRDIIEPTCVGNLFLAPSSSRLADAELNLAPMLSREFRLANALEEVVGDYDAVLVDCPPSLGLLTVNALAAADEVLVPIQCEYYALAGFGRFKETFDQVSRSLNPRLEIGGVLLTMSDGRTRLSEEVEAEVRSRFKGVTYKTVIPRSVRLSEAPSHGEPIQVYDGRLSPGAVAYRYAAREFIERHRNQE